MKETLGNKYLKREIRKTPLKTFQNALTIAGNNSGIKINKVHFKNISTLFLGILITRISRLIKTAERLYSSEIGRSNCVKSLENKLSYFFKQVKRDKLKKINKVFNDKFFYEGFQEISEYSWRYKDRLIMIIDWTAYPKRSRLNKKGMGMEYVGKVYDSREDGPVTGYGGFLGGILLKDENIFPIFHELYSNKYSFKKYRSINDMEIKKIREIRNKLNERLLLIGDTGFCKKTHINDCYKSRIDFLFRLKKDIKIILGKTESTIKKKIKRIKKTYPITWQYKENNKIKEIVGTAKFIKTSTPFRTGLLKKIVPLTLIYIEVGKYEEPMYLVTSLEVTPENIGEIVRLYNKRWAIERFIENLKNIGLEEFMVRRWEAIELICNIILSIYTVGLIVLLTAKTIILVGIINLLKKLTLTKKITLCRLIYVFSLILSPQRQVNYL